MLDQRGLIRRYSRAIVHLRQLLQTQRLGLALGAGVSSGMDLPSWRKLLSSLRDALQSLGVQTHYDEASTSEAVQAQILFAAFRSHLLTNEPEVRDLEAALQDAEITARWRVIVHSILYAEVKLPDEKVSNHPYIRELAALAKRLRFVVSYNFDDMLERSLAKNAKEQPDARTVGYSSAWGSNFVIQDDRPVVYHPNGFLPFDLVDRSSEQILLTEEDLSDQALDFSVGVYRTLFDYFSRAPVFLIGFSLSDPALRSLLRQSLRHSPGIVHYCVHWCGDSRPTEEQQREISESNFDLFGIVTLFLDNEELKFFLELVAAKTDDEFRDEFLQAKARDKYKYCITGVISVGKTASISMLKGLMVVDEWLTLRNPLIAEPWNNLTPVQRNDVDSWIMRQLRLKNQRFRSAPPGIHIMDRAPLDPFAFTPVSEIESKAEMLWREVCSAVGDPEPFERGQLLLIQGRPSDLVVRQRARGRKGDLEYIEKQQNRLMTVYGGSPGLTIIDASGLALNTLARRIAKAIHFEPYEEFDFDACLKSRRAKS